MENYVPVNLAYDVFESINGTDENLSPIIFLHQIGGSKEMWNDIPQKITDRTRRRSYSFDIRDHGDSEWTENFSFNMGVEDIIYFMESKNITRAILVGYSMGGWIAGMIALRKPECIELLICEDIHIAKITKKQMSTSSAYMVLWQEAVESIPKELSVKEGIKFAVDYTYDKLPPHQKKKLTKKECLYNCKYPIKRLQDGSYKVKHNVERIVLNGTKLDTFSDEPKGIYTGPTYIIYGGASHLKVFQHEAKIKEHFPYAELILFEGATHNLHIEFPDKFTEIVLKSILRHS